MRWSLYLILGIFGLLIPLAVAKFQPSPGYMDADYYYAGGARLAGGHGFSEMILWNYLDDPAGLPHASHAYWMPLASIIAAVGMGLTRTIDFSSARLGFLLLAAAIPPLTALLGYTITNRRDFALAAGFLAVFSGYYLPYYSTTDTFGIYMVLGIAFFLLLGLGITRQDNRNRIFIFIGLGAIAGLAHLSRADGLIWLAIASLAGFLLAGPSNRRRVLSVLMVFLGYFLVMAPWFIRNNSEFGTFLSPGGNHALWLASYDQTFSYPAGKLTCDSWLASGWVAILTNRLDALKWNLQTAWAVQGTIFLLPFIVLGIWIYRRDFRIIIGVISWLVTFVLMTIVFPFAGSRGGFLHSGAALQPLWWVLVPAGLERFIVWIEIKRNWRKGEAFKVFMVGAITICALMSYVIFHNRIISSPGWGSESERYRLVETFINSLPESNNHAVLVGNPPGYFNGSNRPAIAIPNEPIDIVVEVAKRYGAVYLILENDGTPSPLKPVFENPGDYLMLQYLGDIDGARIFFIP
jgi:hypothetical protein